MNRLNLAWIDLRDEQAFLQGHHRLAINIPAQDFAALKHELPLADCSLLFYGHVRQLETVKLHLASSRPRVEYQLLDAPFIDNLRRQNLWLSGASTQRYWRASNLIERLVNRELDLPFVLSPEQGLDLACGSGRDVLCLAQAKWQMTAVDCSEDALARLAFSAKRMQLSVQGQRLDLEVENFRFDPAWSRRFNLVHVSRYLHRPLLPLLGDLVAPGGLLIYQTFAQGAEKVGPCRPRNPRYLLAPDEVLSVLGDTAFSQQWIETIDDGRPVAVSLWQKPLTL